MTYPRLLVLLTLALVALFLASLLVGVADMPISDSLSALFGGGEGPLPMVMREIRLPRALLGVMVGVSLGLSGAALKATCATLSPNRA